MSITVERDVVQKLVAKHRAQLVEVLGHHEYEWAHIPGAINIPLRRLDQRAPHELDRDRPVVVYCHNLE